jgi:DNA modification methylase
MKPKSKICNTSSSLAIRYRQLRTLRPNGSNPRSHSKKQIAQIAESIKTFGFNVPILVVGDEIIAGHGRFQASKLLGIDEVPTIELEHLDENQRRAFLIADNRLTENAEWDEVLLGKELKFLSEANLDFSLEAIGFEVAEIDLFIEDLTPATPDEPDPGNELPAMDSRAITKAGDLWILGKNRVLCGNALSKEDFCRLMRDSRANLVFTDPPYNVPIDGHVSGSGKAHHREFVMASGELTTDEFIKFLTDALSLASVFSKSGSLHFVCIDWRHGKELLTAGSSVYTELKNVCVWVKDNPGLGSLYRSQHEFVFVFKNGAEPHRNNVQLGKFGRSRSNVWNYPGANSFARSGSEQDLLSQHPTVKPVALVADAILDCSARGEIVLDPFLGSGTTVIAAERTGRIAYGLELDPLYVDLVVRRWQRFTGKPAVLEGSDKSFDEIAEERSCE